jgi:hypothetical protein
VSTEKQPVLGPETKRILRHIGSATNSKRPCSVVHVATRSSRWELSYVRALDGLARGEVPKDHEFSPTDDAYCFYGITSTQIVRSKKKWREEPWYWIGICEILNPFELWAIDEATRLWRVLLPLTRIQSLGTWIDLEE